MEKKKYGISLDTAQRHLDQWLEAEAAVTTNQSYTVGNRSLTRANLSDIRRQIEYWEKKVKELEIKENGGRRNRMYSIVPRDW